MSTLSLLYVVCQTFQVTYSHSVIQGEFRYKNGLEIAKKWLYVSVILCCAILREIDVFEKVGGLKNPVALRINKTRSDGSFEYSVIRL